MLRAVRPTSPRPEVSDVAWQTVTALVERWQRQPQSFVGLDEAAALAGYEATHFAKLFRQVVGMPPSAYVRGLRLERAALRLEDPGVSITQVAEEAGYGGAAAFSKAFRRRFGCAPRTFRAAPAAPSPSVCPAALSWPERAVVERSFEGWGLPCTPDPESMGPAMEAVRIEDAEPDSLGALAQPWGWSHMAGRPEYVAVQLTRRRPVPRPLWPVWMPRRTWLRVDWTGEPWSIGPAIVWVHGEGLRSLGRLAGFAPTLTFFRADGSLRVWIPLRAT